MENNYELPKLKERDNTDELFKRSLIEYQAILLAKIEDNRRYGKMIEDNNREIALINKKIEALSSLIKPAVKPASLKK